MRAPLVASALLLLSGLAAGQFDPTDPRFEEDPRQAGDPRNARDPRVVSMELAAAERGDPDLLDPPDLFDTLWEQERNAELSRAMQQRPWEVLPYLAGHARSWQLLARRDAASVAAAGASAALGGRAVAAADTVSAADTFSGLCELADLGIVDSHFAGWSASLLEWGPEQLAEAEEARALVGQAGVMLRGAVDENDLLAALTPLHQAAERSRVLGDVPNEARTLLTVAIVQISNGMTYDARMTAEHAVTLARQVRDLDTTWNGLSLAFEASLMDEEAESARETLQSQYQVALEVGDDEVSQQVLERLINLDNWIAGEPTTVWRPAGRTGLLWRPGQRFKLNLGSR